MEHDLDTEDRLMLYPNGIPQGVCTRIRDFLAMDCTDDCWNEAFQPLYHLIYEKTYWTHLNKCFTGGGGPEYNKSVARVCADTWLHEGLHELKALEIRFVIALGRDVQGWIGKNAPNGIEIIKLFHTSRRNNNVWSRKKIDNRTVIAQRKRKEHQEIIRIRRCREECGSRTGLGNHEIYFSLYYRIQAPFSISRSDTKRTASISELVVQRRSTYQNHRLQNSNVVKLWRINGNKTVRLDKSVFDEEKDLEELIKKDPSLLNHEALLIIGQQAEVIDVNDRIDLLAIDKQGNSVIIEVKRGEVNSPDDMQSIRYASYVANWSHDAFEKQADSFYTQEENAELLEAYLGLEGVGYENFVQLLDTFCEEEYELNADQKIILVGTKISDKVLPVLIWLTKKGIDIRFVQVQAFIDEGKRYIHSKTVFPLPEYEEMLVGTSAAASVKPWKTDGRNWHLKKRCSQKTARMTTQIVDDLSSLDEVESVSWKQKGYIAFRIRNMNWAKVKTYPGQINVRFLVRKEDALEHGLLENFKLPEDRAYREESKNWDNIRIKLKSEDEYDSEALTALAKKSLDSFRPRDA